MRIQIRDGVRAACAIFSACWLLAGVLPPTSVSGQDAFAVDVFDAHNCQFTSSDVRAGDEVWLINSREMAHRDCPSESLILYRACGREWCRSDLATFTGEKDDIHRETVFFVHGHRTDLKYAQIRGWQGYQALVGGNTCAPAVRFVIWAWPSDTEHQQHVHSLHKSDLHGFFLARLLFRLDPNVRVRLFGYSLGARLVLGALHLAGGGLMDGHGIGDCGLGQLSPYRVTLVAPAINCDCLETCSSHCRACDLIERLQIFYNSVDPVMKIYRLADRDHHQRALGKAGINSSTRCGTAIDIQQYEVRHLIGRRHSIVYYWECPCLAQQIGCHLFSD